MADLTLSPIEARHAACDFINTLYEALGPLAPKQFSREEQHAIFVLTAFLEAQPLQQGAWKPDREAVARVFRKYGLEGFDDLEADVLALSSNPEGAGDA